ncbi:MAG: hypothetical protein LBP95_06550 [Deltaproteobacteria bacterium]|jgi:hypothetical protein|nr:hypothetical protein [Deltaproteobacteria bacterium]
MVLAEFKLEDFKAANIEDERVRVAKRMIAFDHPDHEIIRASTLPLEKIKSLRVRYLADKKKGVKPEEYI